MHNNVQDRIQAIREQIQYLKNHMIVVAFDQKKADIHNENTRKQIEFLEGYIRIIEPMSLETAKNIVKAFLRDNKPCSGANKGLIQLDYDRRDLEAIARIMEEFPEYDGH